MSTQGGGMEEQSQQMSTRLSYYNVTTRLVDLVGLSWLKQNLVEQIY